MTQPRTVHTDIHTHLPKQDLTAREKKEQHNNILRKGRMKFHEDK